MNLLATKPELSFQMVDVEQKEKYTIQCPDESTKANFEEAIKTCISSAGLVSLSIEEQLKREKDARKKLQEKNAELMQRVRELETELEEEKNLRKSLQDKLK